MFYTYLDSSVPQRASPALYSACVKNNKSTTLLLGDWKTGRIGIENVINSPALVSLFLTHLCRAPISLNTVPPSPPLPASISNCTLVSRERHQWYTSPSCQSPFMIAAGMDWPELSTRASEFQMNQSWRLSFIWPPGENFELYGIKREATGFLYCRSNYSSSNIQTKVVCKPLQDLNVARCRTALAQRAFFVRAPKSCRNS